MTFVYFFGVWVDFVWQAWCEKNIDLGDHGHSDVVLRDILEKTCLREINTENEGTQKWCHAFKEDQDDVFKAVLLVDWAVVAYVLLLEESQHFEYILHFFMMDDLEEDSEVKAEKDLAGEEWLEFVEM